MRHRIADAALVEPGAEAVLVVEVLVGGRQDARRRPQADALPLKAPLDRPARIPPPSASSLSDRCGSRCSGGMRT